MTVDSEYISASGDLCCMTKLGSLSRCVGGDWLVVTLWFQTQMVEAHEMEIFKTNLILYN